MSSNYSHLLLLVDDEESITKALKRLLRKEGFEVHTAVSGMEGLKCIRESEYPYSLIISDQRMPEMSGAEFLEKAQELLPDAMRILLTGYSDLDAVIDAVNKGRIHHYMTKPWNDDELIFRVRKTLEQYELVLENRRLHMLTKRQNEELSDLNKNLERRVEERTKALFLKNKELSRLNRELEQNLFNTVRAFTALSELQYPTVVGHGKRVSALSRELAQFLEMSKKDINHTEIAALMHDIGKFGFPEKLLNCNPGDLTPKERAQFKKHPEEGQMIVRFINRLDQVGYMIRAHHERFDGQGYPDRLKGDDIPLGARIIAVVDIYDNILYHGRTIDSCTFEYLKQKRLVKGQLSQDELRPRVAVFHLKSASSTRYDPEVVDKFVDLLNAKGIVFDGEGQKENVLEVVREKALSIEGLKPGMTLARSVYSSRGRFLLPQDIVLTSEHIEKLLHIQKNERLSDWIYVMEDSGSPETVSKP